MKPAAWLPRRPFTLTARLVAVVVLLVAVTAAVIGTAITLAMERDLESRLDEQALLALAASNRPDRGGPDLDPARDILREGTDGFVAVFPTDSDGAGLVRTEDRGRSGDPLALTQEQLDALLDDMPPRAYAGRSVELPELGSYRVVYRTSFEGTVFVGLHTDDIEHTISELVRLEVLATLLGVLLAGGVGAVVVRRQLAPLREVADTAHRVSELPLAAGEIDLGHRVPDHLTDERTEVGSVGSALNAMLDHVEASLETRHRSEQQVRQFVADASHELRTPLATIAGYTELARRQPETTTTALTKVETESARMTGLVEDLLLLARLDSGRPLEREPVDLSRLLLEAVNDARVVDAGHQWRLSLPDEPLSVTGDAARLHQVVTNLLTNASKYTPAGTTVTITGTAEGFTVHDDGPGFAPDLASRAFERFTRGDSARNRAGGAGLGLSLVEAIVAAHGGSVRLASEPDDTSIAVRLPSG